jgi:hypothetical protein
VAQPETDCLTLADFTDTDYPDIVAHIIHTLTGVNTAIEVIPVFVEPKRVLPAKITHHIDAIA